MLEWSGGLWLSWLGVVETVGPSLPRITKNITMKIRFIPHRVQDGYIVYISILYAIYVMYHIYCVQSHSSTVTFSRQKRHITNNKVTGLIFMEEDSGSN